MGGRYKREGIWGICIHIADSLFYTTETNTTVESNYTPPIKMLFKKKESQEGRKGSSCYYYYYHKYLQLNGKSSYILVSTKHFLLEPTLGIIKVELFQWAVRLALESR